MNIKQLKYRVQRYPKQSDCNLKSFSIFVLSAHHSSHHHEHSAH